MGMYVKKLFLVLFSIGTVACSSEEEVPPAPEYDPPITYDLIISEVRVTSFSEEGGFRNTFVEVYNGTGTEVDLSSYGLWYSSNGSNGSWDKSTQLTFSGSLAHGEVIIIVREGTDSKIFPFPDYVWEALKANGDDGIALIKDSGNGFKVIDQ